MSKWDARGGHTYDLPAGICGSRVIHPRQIEFTIWEACSTKRRQDSTGPEISVGIARGNRIAGSSMESHTARPMGMGAQAREVQGGSQEVAMGRLGCRCSSSAVLGTVCRSEF